MRWLRNATHAVEAVVAQIAVGRRRAITDQRRHRIRGQGFSGPSRVGQLNRRS